MDTLDQINRHQRTPTGFNDVRLGEGMGAVIIDPQYYEPDAATHRYNYYYNSRTDTLYYRKWIKRDTSRGIFIAAWIPMIY